MTDQERLRANAELVVRQLGEASGVEEFGYNAESVAWVDGFIERQRERPDFDAAAAEGLSQTLGSYLGECVIRCHGGEWRQEGGTWAVAFDADNAVFPFNKVRKHLGNGPGDSVRAWFDSIPAVFARQLAPKKRPWWKFGG